jgi:hypothetical protein
MQLSEIKRTEVQLDDTKARGLRSNLPNPWMTVSCFRGADSGDLDPVRRTSLWRSSFLKARCTSRGEKRIE